MAVKLRMSQVARYVEGPVAVEAPRDDWLHAVLVHDLKTPTRAARMLLQLTMDRGIEDPDLRERLECLDQTMVTLGDRIDAILRLAGAEYSRMRVERLDMQALAEQAAQQAGISHGAVVDIQELPACYGDRILVEQVIGNLIENACKHGAGQVKVRGARRGEGSVYWVSDDGPGVPDDERERLFEPFRRGRQLRSAGHGLGLAIVRRVIERHGGSVRIEPGPGFTVRFRLPAQRRW